MRSDQIYDARPQSSSVSNLKPEYTAVRPHFSTAVGVACLGSALTILSRGLHVARARESTTVCTTFSFSRSIHGAFIQHVYFTRSGRVARMVRTDFMEAPREHSTCHGTEHSELGARTRRAPPARHRDPTGPQSRRRDAVASSAQLW